MDPSWMKPIKSARTTVPTLEIRAVVEVPMTYPIRTRTEKRLNLDKRDLRVDLRPKRPEERSGNGADIECRPLTFNAMAPGTTRFILQSTAPPVTRLQGNER
jgi:hypothetical protein